MRTGASAAPLVLVGFKVRFFAVFLLALNGCVNVDLAESGSTKTFVGIVRVTTPDTAGRVTAIDVKSLGVGWDRGPYLGWKAGNWIVADPAQCQLLVVIRSPVQAESAERVIRSLGGQNACIADFTHTLGH